MNAIHELERASHDEHVRIANNLRRYYGSRVDHFSDTVLILAHTACQLHMNNADRFVEHCERALEAQISRYA